MTIPTPDAICERLREGILVFGPKDCGCPMVDVVTANQAMRKAADLIQQQQATIERLSAALEPFADRLNTLETNCRKLNCGVPGETNVRTAWLREARAALGRECKEE